MSQIDPLLDKPGGRLRLASTLADVLMATPEFRAVHMELGHRELRALVVAGQVLDAAEAWLKIARIADQVTDAALGDGNG